MYSSYDSPWQRSTNPPHNTAYRPPPLPSLTSTHQEPPRYPPKPNEQLHVPSYDPSFLASKPSHEVTDGAALRGGTPSPTPSEQKELTSGAIDWKAMTKWRFWIRREWLWYYVALVIILVLSALMTLYHKQIVHWLTPVTQWLHGHTFGWIVPIAVLFIISFPPLFGHEIVAILCGLVWGLWVGFGIVAAGTFLGEVGNFYAFKYCCRSRGEKLEKNNISYACLAQVVRDGGFKIALIARLSAIPGHFTTAVFSTCGMGIIVFSIAAILSMPKQFITVYLGVILEQSAEGTTDTKSRIISDVVLAVTILITVLAMWYILRRMNKVKPQVIHARRKARQAKLERGQLDLPIPNGHIQDRSYTTLATYNGSESDIPLTSRAAPMGSTPAFPEPKHFQESSSEHSYDSYLHAPQPQRAGRQIPHVYPEEDSPDSAEPLHSAFDHSSSYGQVYPPPPTTYNPFNPVRPPVPSDATYNTRVETTTPSQPVRPSSSGSYSPRNFSRPLRSPSPPRQHTHPQRFNIQEQSPRIAGPPAYSSSNAHIPSPNPQQGYHVHEETYDSFHTAHTASPEPMNETDFRSPNTQHIPSSNQQQGMADSRGQDPRRWDEESRFGPSLR